MIVQPFSRLLRQTTRAFIGRRWTHSLQEEAIGSRNWKLATFFVAFPGVAVTFLNAFVIDPEEHSHPEFVPYENIRIRTKAFPWGDGNHSLMHNSYTNALPEGYEEVKHHSH